MFEKETSKSNLLPRDGEAEYFGMLIDEAGSGIYFEKLLAEIAWQHDEVIIFEKHIMTKRKTAWYGDKAFTYSYSGTAKTALPWTTELLELKALIEKISGEHFNSCLLNLYHDGSEGMSWHSDDEKTIVKNSAIASMSLGAERKFSFRHKQTKETSSLVLENGSLLVMKAATQHHWQHSLPKTVKITGKRINLTFRKFVEES
jgi:alkylated DNA repair dioxygenase AlkB